MITYTKPSSGARIAPNRRPPEEVIAEALALEVDDLPENAPSAAGSTFYKKLRRCAREFRLHQLGVAEGGGRAEALDLGFIWHAALERCWKEMKAQQDEYCGADVYNDPGALDAVDWGACESAAWQVLFAFQDEPGYEETFPILETMLGRYFEEYRRSATRWRIVASEITLEYVEDEADVSPEVAGPMVYTARLDLLVVEFDEYDTPLLWIVEHKTASRIDDLLLDNYQLDLQIVGQVWLLNHCVDVNALPPFAGVIIDLTSKPRTPGGKLHLKRQPVCPSLQHQESHEHQVRFMRGQQLPIYEAYGYPPSFGNCAGAAQWFRRCAYYDVCQAHPLKTPEQIAKIWESEDE